MQALKNRTTRFASSAALAICLGGLSAPTQAADACETVLCMAGMAMGGGKSSECSDAYKEYFSIIKFHHGSVSLSRTANARESFLEGCEGADADTISTIQGSFGRVLGL